MALRTLTTEDVKQLIADGESLTVEFKSEKRVKLSDKDIYTNVVCLANSDGGTLLLGVEDNGDVTGAAPRHSGSIDPVRLQTAVFNNTVPSINSRVTVHQIQGHPVVAIDVDSIPEICATKDGRCVRRVMGANGPECRPYYPREHTGRRSDLGLIDYSAQLADGFDWNDFDPLEFERLRQTITRWRGERSLLSLNDRELAQALQLVETREGQLVPNLAGLLLLGKEGALRQALPSHEIAFQVLVNDVRGGMSVPTSVPTSIEAPDRRVLVNDWFHGPLLKTLEIIEERFIARITEQEVSSGVYRIPIPTFDSNGFREALANAASHRDYSQLGTVLIQFQADELQIASPGGFLGGITMDNLLVHEPKPRNPRLNQALRRIGLVETTGRGIDVIYLGQLRYGRQLPDYSRSDNTGVRLVLRSSGASAEFTRFVFEEVDLAERSALQILIALNLLLENRRVRITDIARAVQQDESETHSVMEGLAERGWVEATGSARSPFYELSAALYERLESRAGYGRLRRLDSDEQGALVLEHVAEHGSVTRREVVDLLDISARQANYLLRTLIDSGDLRLVGQGRGAHYVLDEDA